LGGIDYHAFFHQLTKRKISQKRKEEAWKKKKKIIKKEDRSFF